MQERDASTILDLVGAVDPWVLAVMAIVVLTGVVLHIRNGAPAEPARPFDLWPDDDDDGLGEYTLEDFRKEYNPDDKWNRAPTDHTRL